MPTDDDRHGAAIAAWSAFLRAHAAVVRRIERDLERRTSLALGWYDVLLELNSAPGRRLRMNDLSEVAVLSRSRVSRIVDELTAAGLVERQPNPLDLRSSYAAITPQGRSVLRKAAPTYLAIVEEHFGRPLNSEQLQAVRSAMEALLAKSSVG